MATVGSSPLLGEDAVKQRRSDFDAKLEGEAKAGSMSKYTKFRKESSFSDVNGHMEHPCLHSGLCSKGSYLALFCEKYDLATAWASLDIESYWPNVASMMFCTAFFAHRYHSQACMAGHDWHSCCQCKPILAGQAVPTWCCAQQDWRFMDK